MLHGEAASKLFETWLTIYAEKVLYLARQEGNLTLPLDGLTPLLSADLVNAQGMLWKMLDIYATKLLVL